MKACREIIQNAKLAPAAKRAKKRIVKFGLLAAATAATANSNIPTSIVRHMPKRDTNIPAGTSNIKVPMYLAPTARPIMTSVANNSSLAKIGRTGIRTP